MPTYSQFEWLSSKESSNIYAELYGFWYKMVEVEEYNFLQQASILHEAYTNLITLESLSNYVSQTLLGSMSSLGSRGYDLDGVEDSQYSFAVKADGERLWLALVGYVWLYSRRFLGHRIVGWGIDEEMLRVHNTSYGPVLDIEIFIGHKPIIIDILMMPDSSLTLKERNIEWVHNEFHDMASRIQYLNSVQTRKLYNSYSEALDACSEVQYSTDGVVALHRDGIDIVKLKTIKSMELEATPNGDMVSSEGIKILNVSHKHQCESGFIYEIGMYI
ncbi:hypothetical protein GcC1_040036 [Golovinomyces cichoracearum]|uniref:Uncharacterized protein n=1 Tax=Golovinomyces cichoracearum TaxID=62708 RepID=A0A420IZX6_9PEZI|nr:hypothetical protein GcC1_040036 [Golovinomyces cichoracearum]